MFAIVAIPQQDDYVWRISSEKVPHMTICAFEDPGWSAEELSHALDYTEHSASLLPPFGLGVDYRGELGDKKADVLFFEAEWAYQLKQFRSNILADPVINAAVFGDDNQYDTWVPHLTMGFPETPAKKDTRDYPGVSWVSFDRIAFWVDNYSGPTFRLRSDHRGLNEVAAMAEIDYASDILEHYGVKGMKWGVRKRGRTLADSTERHRLGIIKGSVKSEKSTGHLNNAQLKEAIERMRLEQEFSRLSGGIDKTNTQKTKAFIAKLLTDAGKQTIQQAANNEAKKKVDSLLK